MSIDPALIERAHDAFNREYCKCWSPGGDEGDHEDAERAGIEAVIALVQAEPSPPASTGPALPRRTDNPGDVSTRETPSPAASIPSCADDDPGPARASSPARARGPVDDDRRAA